MSASDSHDYRFWSVKFVRTEAVNPTAMDKRKIHYDR
jgi:hypothetical protein